MSAPVDAPLPERLAALLEHLGHVLPAQAPIRDFVHHNTLHGYQHLPFHEALRAARRELGIRAYLPAADFRACLAAGRIVEADLEAVLDERPGSDEAVAAIPGKALRRRDLLLAALRHDLSIPAPATLPRRLAETGVAPALF